MLWFAPKMLANLFLAVNLILVITRSFAAVVLSKHLLIEYQKHPQDAIVYHPSIGFSTPFEFPFAHLVLYLLPAYHVNSYPWQAQFPALLNLCLNIAIPVLPYIL